MDTLCPFCRAYHWIDERVTSSSLRNPQFEMCCQRGKIKISLLSIPPQPLYDLFVDHSAEALDFRRNIVQYNASLAFTSMGVDIDRSVSGRGPPVFRIHGELTHLAGSLLPEDNKPPIYAQLYIYDQQHAFASRVVHNENLFLNTFLTLQHMLSIENSYSRLYQHAYEVLKHYNGSDLFVRLCVLPGNDPRRYNEPTADEVGVILPGDDHQGDYRDIILHLRPQYWDDSVKGKTQLKLERISEGHPAYVPLHYVLFFPRGEPGWYQGLRIPESPRQVTLLQYTAFRIHPRHGEFSTIIRGYRLFQRYLVDMFAAIDQERLRFIRTQQPKLRITMLGGLEDAVFQEDQDLNLSQIGQRIILPASYHGGPRDMHQRYLDGMAIARHFKKIDIFLTMTANPKWPEIERELLPGQTAADCPDLIVRVFQLKKKALIKAIVKDGILGPCIAHVYAIEFQKRGLPHMHLLIFLKREYKLQSPEVIDSIISAEWPDPDLQPHLFSAVKKFMIHGPCGALNPHASCMKNGTCSAGYPKPHQLFTTMDEHSYPRYRRRNDGRAFEVRGAMLDNRWVVPFNPFCVLWMYCHINLECTLFFGSMKYINKYLNKGGDCGTLQIQHGDDEVKQYINGRYFSAAEAAWRIFQFPVHDQHPNVVRLALHLPHEQCVVFNPSKNARQIVEYAHDVETGLTAFFKANSAQGNAGEIARHLTYQEFPQHFVLKNDEDNHQSKYWSLRQRKSFALGRMAYVTPTAGEKFYLRTLLMVVRGAKSFDDLKTVNGVRCETFQSACLRRGLLEDDGEWRMCLQDAADMQTGCQLRHLFVTILLFSAPAEPTELWLEFRHLICDDLEYQLHQLGRTIVSENDIYDFGLYLIDEILHDSGHALADFPSMPSPSQGFQTWFNISHNRLISQQTNYNTIFESMEADRLCQTLNSDQRAALLSILKSIQNNEGKIFFIDGSK
jgi:hypothetical protein